MWDTEFLRAWPELMWDIDDVPNNIYCFSGSNTHNDHRPVVFFRVAAPPKEDEDEETKGEIR